MLVGTGVGGGIVIDGRPLVGANAIAGEWGHNDLPRRTEDDWPLPACYCGRTGCIETFVSGPGVAADHGRQGGEHAAGPVDDRELRVAVARRDHRVVRNQRST
mgnify:CR=1 FL=1